ncbi:MAG: hypothetical protein HY996_12195 [Micrococcales bacterium]|nr:hypothetical protein [Micrococcales bacterium]
MRPIRALPGVAAAALAAILGVLSLGPLPASAADSGGTRPTSVGANGRIGVAVIVPITVPRSTGGLLTADQLTKATADGGQLAQELDQVEGLQAENVPLTLAVDPRIIASIRVLGTGAPPTARGWLDRLASLPNAFPLAYADADPVLLGQAGRSDSLAPQDFGFALDPADFGPAVATPSPTPTATPAPGDRPALPQTPQELLAWNWRYDDIVWPASGTVVAADLPRLTAAGYGTVLLDQANADGATGRVALATSASASSGPTALVADSDLSAAASAVADAADFAEAERGIEPLRAAVTAAAADAGSAVRVVTLDREADPRAFLQSMSITMSGAGADLVPLSAALNAPAVPATILDRPEPAGRISAVVSVLNALDAEASFATVAVTPADVTAPRRLTFLALLGAGWVGDEGWATRVSTFLRQSATLRSSVTITPSSSGLALGTNPQLPVAIRNQLDVPIRVYAIARPLRGNLVIPADRRRVEVTVQANSAQTGRIPTQSVANGKVRVEVSLQSASGVSIGRPSTLSINVQAGWETAGTLIALVIVLGVFGFGVTRNILRRRAIRRGDAGASA